MGYFAEHGRRWGAVSVFIALVAAATAWGQTPEAVRKDSKAPAPSTPIQIAADHGSTWIENGDRVFFLQGNIRLEQGATAPAFGFLGWHRQREAF